MRDLLVLASLALVTVTATAGAQSADSTAGPRRGTWGAEASLGNSGSLLKFRSTRTSWVLSVSGSTRRSEYDRSGGAFGGSSETGSESFSWLSLGLRRYGGASALRPFAGGGLRATFSRSTGSGDSRNIGAGAYAEYGAAWFFNPHVSLGAIGAVNAGWNRQRYESSGITQEATTFGADVRAVQLVGSVYF